ncbi:MAG: CAP domain-containing protein [Candidatus Nanopelagicales bacterium]
MFVRGVVVALMVTGLAAPAVAAAPAPGSHASPLAASQAAITWSAVPAARAKPRASLRVSAVVVASGKVRVSVTTNAKRVTLTYRTAKSKKRSATIEVRKGPGVKKLATGSKRIHAQAKATSKLRTSVRIRVIPSPPAPPRPTPKPTPTPSSTPTPRPTLSSTPTPNPTPNPSSTPTPTASTTPTPTATPKPTASGTPTPTPTTSSTPTPSVTPTLPAEQVTAAEAEVLTLVNGARAVARSCGTTNYAAAPALTMNPLLVRSARGHSQDMATNGYFSHTGLDGSLPWDRMRAVGYEWRAAGENIAAGQPTAQAVVTAWLNSPGHCANIMSDRFTEIGVGYVYSKPSAYGHYWTQNLGRR